MTANTRAGFGPPEPGNEKATDKGGSLIGGGTANGAKLSISAEGVKPRAEPPFHALAKNRHRLSPPACAGSIRRGAEAMSGFVKLMRGPDTDELLLDPPAFALLAQVALRARRRATDTTSMVWRSEKR
jgi:hypothetical protein